MTKKGNSVIISPNAGIAQSVERGTENPCVGGSTPPPGILKNPFFEIKPPYRIYISMKKNILLPSILFILTLLLNSSTHKITVITPNGGELFHVKEEMMIKWNYPEGNNVILILYREGIKFKTISESVSNTGTFIWTIPTDLPSGDQYRIRIRSKSDFSVNDFSDGNFAIRKK